MSALSIVGLRARDVRGSGELAAPTSPSVPSAPPAEAVTDEVTLSATQEPPRPKASSPAEVATPACVPSSEGSAAASSPAAIPSGKVPSAVKEGADRYQKSFLLSPRECPDLHGIVYQQYEDGRVVVLKRAWETTPDIPASGPDIPADAVRDNRVFIYVDGIHQTMADQQDQIHRLFQAPRTDPKHGTSIDQPAIGIHEAAGPNAGIDGARIALDLSWLKALQGGYLPTSWVRKASFITDAAVKSVHNEVRQSLAAGRDVQIALHSGGGAETALALNLLAKEDGGRWKNAISEHVRILALAPAAAFEDFEMAGVKTENIYYTASKEDPVYRLAHKYVEPWQMVVLMARSAAVGIDVLFNRESIPYHSPDYIFWRNVAPDGTQPIQSYLDGGPGGEHILS